MSKQQNLVANIKLGEPVTSGDFSIFDQVFASNVVDHDPAPEQGPGPEGFKKFFTMMRTAFPDLNVSVDHLTQSETDIAMAYTIHGTHKGLCAAIAPTGKTIAARGMQIGRFENEEIVEWWGSSDVLGILETLGAKVV
jgi:predicted ester cyclase